MKKYDAYVMGEMLKAGFNNSELQSLAFSLDFDLPDEISHLPKSQKVINIVTYAINKGAGDKVVNYVEENNSYQYNQYKSRLIVEVPDDEMPTASNTGQAGSQTTSHVVNTTNINSDGGSVYQGGVTVAGDFVGGNVTHYHMSDNDAELKEIQQGISQLLNKFDQLQEKEPIVQNITNNNQVYNFGDNNQGIINVGHIEKIENSFNTVSDSSANDDLKQMLNIFLEEIKTLSNNPPAGKEEDVDNIVKNGELLVEQASSSNPDKDWVGLSLSKLKQAAENIGELAGPIVLAAGKIITALGIGL
ncbi:MAG: hypothetical protein AAGD96_29095 [Chloroflexota bacterium]